MGNAHLVHSHSHLKPSKDWSVEQVCEFVSSLGASQSVVNAFRHENINGEILIKLSEDDIQLFGTSKIVTKRILNTIRDNSTEINPTIQYQIPIYKQPIINQIDNEKIEQKKKINYLQVNRFECGLLESIENQFYFPTTCVYDNRNQNLIVCECARDRLQIVKAIDGCQIRLIGNGEGNAFGQFKHPHGIAINQNRIFVCDRDNNRVQWFNIEDGHFLNSFDVGSNAQCIVIGSNGCLFVSNFDKHDVRVFGEDGSLIKRIGGGQSCDPGRFNKPDGIAIDSQERILIGDTKNKRISVFDSKLNFIENFGEFAGGPLNLIVDSFDQIIVCDSRAHRLQVFSPKFDLISTFGSKGSELGQFINPAGLCFDENQSRLFVCDYFNHRMQVIDFSIE